MTKWFKDNSRLSLANGVTSALGGIGSFLGPLVFPVLYDKYGEIQSPLLISSTLCFGSFLFATGVATLDYVNDKRDN